ncbi:hypothetical protein F511_29710 [Dorcoceras hygrometricum]|uniref:Uncharacterized protein n=1 Tax=Dorcoceras hygrometricum TaxID=472368 RepID=A0A2Z7C0W2_9LAMI|nr:hypothetical protein F511_29710 [Dorcoceras hygrometricum]
MRIRPPEFETSICDVKYHVSLSTRCVLGKWVVTHTMSLFDLRDVCMVIGSLATLDLPMVVDLIGIFVLKGPYCTLTMTNWFLQALSVIPRGSWGDVARRFTMIRWERTKRKKFLRGLRPELFRMVLAGSPVTYAEAVDRAVDIEESLMEVQNQVQPIAGRSFQPVPEAMPSFQYPQVPQQSNCQRFKPRGKL